MCIKRMNLYLHEDFENKTGSNCSVGVDTGRVVYSACVALSIAIESQQRVCPGCVGSSYAGSGEAKVSS
jgi:hypothetical protein